MNNNREYRPMELRFAEGDDYIVEGYASTFEPYKMMERDGVDYYERIAPTAFEGADLSDVVFRVDHQGRVYARTSAGSLEVWTDEHGLANRTDLSRTQKAQEIFDDIKAGNYPQMSFCFTVADQHFDRATHTRVIDRIAKVFDVSPCAFVANPTTELGIATRDYFDGVIEMEKAERLEREARERQKQIIRILAEG